MKSLLPSRGVRRSFFVLIGAVLIISISLISSAFAISRGYQTDDDSLKPGMVVSLNPDSNETSPTVKKASEDDLQNIIGVATTVEESSITVASSGQTVFVESEGEIRAYVSDVNGPVNQGDQLTLSPLNGILAGKTDNSRIIFATALENFPAEGLQTHEITTNEGTKTTSIGLMRINLDTKLIATGQSNSSLERLGRSISGKSVSEIRVIVALVVFLLVLFAEGGILYGSTSSAMTSLGRNPLAGRVIRRQLVQVMFVAFGVLAIGLVSIYLILWV